MNILGILSLVTGLLPLATQIGQLWENSAGFAKIAATLLNSPALKSLEEVGAAMFPGVDKAIQTVLAALHLAYPQSTKWIQTSLNAIQSLGVIKFGDPLVVDGLFGPKTFAAVVVLQAHLGLKVTGAVTDLEYAAINKLLGH